MVNIFKENGVRFLPNEQKKASKEVENLLSIEFEGKNAGFVPGSGGIPAEYLNSYLSGKSAWVANPELQVEATKVAKQLRNDYEADVRLRANNKHS